MSFARSNTTPAQVRATIIESKCLELRRDGYNYDEIAAKLGLPREKVNVAVRKALKKLKAETHENAKEVQNIELHRLDHLFYHAMLHVRGGEYKAISTALAVMERRAKLLGMDAAIKAEVVTRQEVDLTKLTVEQLDAMTNIFATEQADDATEDSVDLDADVDYPEEVIDRIIKVDKL